MQIVDEETARPRIGAGWAFPKFDRRAVRNEEKSEAEGRPVYDERDFVTLFHPGDGKTRPCYEVTPRRLRQWRDNGPREYVKLYENWKKTQDNTVEGTPLAEWPRMTRARVAELRDAGITTVEQVAELSGDIVDKFHLRREQQEAQRFLKPENQQLTELKKSERRLESEVENLKAQLAQMQKGAA